VDLARVLVGVAGIALIALMLTEVFFAFLLPRRVKRAPRVARRAWTAGWRPWRRLAGRLAPDTADTVLGLYGPLALVGILALWALGVMVGFAAIQWALGSNLGSGGSKVGFLDDLYFSAGGFLDTSTGLAPHDAAAKVAFLAEVATGFGVIFIVIGYLPSLFQAFSRREVAVSQLDPRAGSPPTAGALLVRSATLQGWDDLDEYLSEWEAWAAELMETHLSYPSLAFFRSQHLNQNWLAALTCVLDAAAFAMASAPPDAPTEGAQLSFAIGRHALADLGGAFNARPTPPLDERLTDIDQAELRGRLEAEGMELADPEAAALKLAKLRASYEPLAVALSQTLALALPVWIPGEDASSNWRVHVHDAHGR
jgi:hypothetical protein